ncbi:hypothetical protein LCGC14_1303960, partial [marine sediment metagenome]
IQQNFEGSTYYDSPRIQERISSKVKYDTNGNYPIQTEDANGNVADITYDSVGNVLTATAYKKVNQSDVNLTPATVTYTYDALSRLLTRTSPATNQDDNYDYYNVTYVTTTYEYDKDGRLIKTTSPEGVESTTTYLANGLVESVVVSTPVYNSTISITANAVDSNQVQKVEFYVDDVLYKTVFDAPYSFDLDSSTITNGEHTIKTVAYDIAGFTSETRKIIDVENSTQNSASIDTIPPDAPTIYSPLIDTWMNTTNFSIGFSPSSDNVALLKHQLYIDGNLAEDNISPVATQVQVTDALPNGLHSMYLLAIDTNGNSTKSYDVPFGVDITQPSVTIAKIDGSTLVKDSPITIEGYATSGYAPLTEVWLYVISPTGSSQYQATGTNNWSITFTPTETGTYKLYASAYNVMNNSGSSPFAYLTVVDNSGPYSFDIIDPIEDNNANPNISWSAPPRTDWIDSSSWDYRKAITIDNTGNTSALNDYQIKIDVDYDSDMASDFSDLKFSESDGTTPLSYWIESYTASTSATAWVVVPSIDASSIETIYMYFGDQSATSLSSRDSMTKIANHDFENGWGSTPIQIDESGYYYDTNIPNWTTLSSSTSYSPSVTDSESVTGFDYAFHAGPSKEGTYYAAIGGDYSTGVLRSLNFTLVSGVDRINFLRAGGADSPSGVELIRASDDAVLGYARTGTNTNTFFSDSILGLSSYAGTVVYLKAKDGSASGWGKTAVDDFHQADSSNNPIDYASIEPLVSIGAKTQDTSQPWSSRKKVTIDNAAGATTLTDYQVLLDSEEGVVANYHFDENSGLTVNDSSRNGNNGTLTFNTTWTTGQYGQALNFDGYSYVYSMWPSNSSSLDISTNQISLEAWVYPTSNSASSIIVNKESSYEIALNGGIFQAAVETTASSGWAWGGTQPVSLNTWSHLVFVYDSINWNFYINGALVETIAPANNQTGNIIPTIKSLGIGARESSGLWTSFFNGKIDEVKIYDRALSILDIQNNMNSNSFWQNVKTDGSDIRITDSDGITELPYWIESFNNSPTTKNYKIWAKVPTIAASSSKDIYMYYGNASAISTSDGDRVFDFFDDFNDGVIDSSKWPTQSLFSMTENGGELTFYLVSGDFNYIQSNGFSSAPIVIEARTKTVITPTNGWSPVMFWQSTTEGASILEHSGTGGGRQYARNDGTWYTMGDNKPLNSYHINSLIIESPTQWTAKSDYENSSSADWSASYGNTFSGNYYIRIGPRHDNYVPALPQLMDGRVDWILARQFASTVPTTMVSSEESYDNGYYTYQLYVDYDLDRDNLTSASTTVSTSLAEGIHSAYVVANSGSGPQRTDTSTFIIDNTLPSSTITSPANNSLQGFGEVIITGTAYAGTYDVGKVEVSLDGGNTWNLANGTYSWSYNANFSVEKTYTIKSRAYSNNSVVQAVPTAINIDVDARKPSVSFSSIVRQAPDTQAPTAPIITAPGSGFTNTPNPTIEFIPSSDDVALLKYQLYVDNNLEVDNISNVATQVVLTNSLANGLHSIYLLAIDTSGNSTKSSDLSLGIDTTNPSVSITSPQTGGVYTGSSITVQGRSASLYSQVSSVEVSVNGSAWFLANESTSWTYDLAATSGTYTIDAKATNEVGNTAT